MDTALTTTRRLISELLNNMEQQTNSIVYDPLGDRAGLIFNAARGDRVLELRNCLYAGDIMVLESYLVVGRGSILYVRPDSSDESRVAAAVLFEYASHKLLREPGRLVRLYPGEVTRGPALRKYEQLLASQEQLSQALAA